MEELEYLFRVLNNNLKELEKSPNTKVGRFGIVRKLSKYEMGEKYGKIEQIECTMTTIQTMIFRLNK